jgi:hypothetical protein
MRKPTGSLWAALAVLLCMGLGEAQEEGSWFDLQSCAFCSHLMQEPGLMENMGWEHHLTQAGMISVTTFKNDAAAEAYERATAKMDEAGKQLAAGADLHMCNFCKSMMSLYTSGEVQFEDIPFQGGRILLVSSANPEMVQKIHAHGQRTIDELATLEALGEGED